MSGHRPVGVIYRKELRESLRDRRTLLVMLLLPLCLYPLLALAAFQWLGLEHAQRQREPLRVGLVGPAWGELEARLRQHDRLLLERATDAAAVAKGHADAVLVIPETFRTILAEGRRVSVTAYFDETRPSSLQAKQHLEQAVTAYNRALLQARLAQHSLPKGFARPLAFVAQSTATPVTTQRYALANILPLLVVLMILLGAFYPAIDLTAGEKERGTLETLLVAPVAPFALVLGKFFVVATIAALTGLVNLASMGLTFGLGFQPALQAAGVQGSVLVSTALLAMVGILPAALFFAAVMMAVASLARGFKDAQNLLTPVYVCCLLPVLLTHAPGVTLTPLTALVPVINIALLLQEMIGGKLDVIRGLLVALSTAGYTLAALAVAVRIFRSERLLFAPDPELVRALRKQRERQAPDPAEVGMLLLLILALVVLIGYPLQMWDLALGLLVTEWGLIALPVVLLLRLGNVSPTAALSLKRPPWRAWVGAALTGISAWYLVGVAVKLLQEPILPLPPEMAEQARRLFLSDRGLFLDLLLLAVSPAICEELLFRGVILRASQRVVALAPAILINGLLFGVFHLNVYRFFPTFVLGMMLALIVVRTGSIYPAMLFHLLNNASAVLIGRLWAGHTVDEVQLSAPWGMVAVALFLLGGYFLRQRVAAVTAASPPLGGGDR